MKESKGKIPVLPVNALQNKEFRNYLLCSLSSPEDGAAQQLARLESAYNQAEYKSNFDKLRADKDLLQKKEKIISETKLTCDPKIKAPMFYSDVYFPFSDRGIKPGQTIGVIAGKFMEMTDTSGRRVNSSGAGTATAGILYLQIGSHNIRVDNKLPDTFINWPISDFESIYNKSENYKGTRIDFKGKKEATGRIYFSLAKEFGADFVSKPNYVFWLYPEHYELLGRSGVYKSFKPWRRNEYNYSARNLYAIF